MSLSSFSQSIKSVPYGDFEHWIIRDLKESTLIGGQTKRIYEIGPSDTIIGNKVWKSNSIWGNSNAYAKIAGVVKTSMTVSPDYGENGMCAKLETRYAECKVLGLVNVKILVSGCIFWGKQHEPITSASNPYSKIDWGIPFNTKPKAIVLDYKSVMPNKGIITKCYITSSSSYKGNDEQEIMFILQHRWEDNKGNVYAKRVGTAVYHIKNGTNGWVNDFKIPIIYGDARQSSSYQPYMGLGPKKDNYYTINSTGDNVPINEVGWGNASMTVTHAILVITASIQEAYSGTIGNTLWIDNIKLEY